MALAYKMLLIYFYLIDLVVLNKLNMRILLPRQRDREREKWPFCLTFFVVSVERFLLLHFSLTVKFQIVIMCCNYCGIL